MTAHAPSAAFSHANSAAAGGLGLPLAFVALPFFFQQQLARPALETGVLMSVWALVVELQSGQHA